MRERQGQRQRNRERTISSSDGKRQYSVLKIFVTFSGEKKLKMFGRHLKFVFLIMLCTVLFMVGIQQILRMPKDGKYI